MSDEVRQYFDCQEYSNVDMPTHLHRNLEIIHVVSGEMVITVNNCDEVIDAGKYALIFPNTLHSCHTTTNSQIYMCAFSSDLGPPFVRKTSSKIPERAVFECRDSVNEFVLKEFFVLNSKPDWYTLKASLYAILGEYRSQVNLITLDENNSDVLQKYFMYIEEHFKENISFADVAKHLKYERHYLSQYINKRSSLSFSKIVNQYRVETATELLRNTDLSISDIAFESGFQSIRTFNRVYFELTGRTPKQVSDGKR